MLLTATIMLAVVNDPYTFHESASDDQWPAVWWQTAIALSELVLLTLAMWRLWRGDHRGAVLAAASGAVVNLLLVLSQVSDHGLSRFVAGQGAREYLSLYLISLLGRVVLIAWLGVSAPPRILD